MNRSLKLSMLIALALGSSQVMAIDYGQAQVKSALGQPLLVEIPLHPDNPAELKGLTAQLASSEDFARAGIVGGRTAIPLRFSVVDGGAGKSVIRITSSTPVNDPFLDLLIQINDKDGKSIREYAVLLDPPDAPPAAPVAAAPAPSKPATRPAAAAPAAAPTPSKPVAAPPAAPKAPPLQFTGSEYGPVQSGQTLSGIARDVAPAGVDVQQMMLALQQANPDAFYRDNINALKSGAVLRMPSSAEAQAMTLAAAAAEVRRQNSDWRAGVPSAPAVVADAATRRPSGAPSSETPDPGDRLALVPAKEGSSTGTQGNGAGGKSAASLRQDLLRTQESLVSLQQQSSDLKERLKDLSDINGKNERLLTLKDNEIAELQNKLAAARKAAGLAPVAPASEPAPDVLPQDGMTEAALPSEPTTELASASTAGMQALPASATTAAVASLPAAAGSLAAAPVSEASVAVAPVVASTPVKAEAEPAPAQRSVTKQPRAPAPQPWYMETWAWAAGAGAVALLILLGLLGRRRKSGAGAAPAKPSLADRFGAAPAPVDEDILAEDNEDLDQDQLLGQLSEHPDDLDLHLELVSLYHARRDVEHFEAAAEAMYAHISDPQQEEWQDVVHMGEDLSPGHPLFDRHASSAEPRDEDALGTFDIDDYAGDDEAPTVVAPMPPLPPSAPKKVSEYSFNFDLTQPGGESADAPVADAEPAPDDITLVAPVVADEPAAPTETESSWQFDAEDSPHAPLDDTSEMSEFSDDPVDTKLDLARAYIDMGDAEGARAMLSEVSNEGSQIQRDTAQRLLDNLG